MAKMNFKDPNKKLTGDQIHVYLSKDTKRDYLKSLPEGVTALNHLRLYIDRTIKRSIKKDNRGKSGGK